jgi:hypothetical protein
MCKSLVSMEIYDNERIAFATLENLRMETSMAWSMFKKIPDEFGHTCYEIYGLFDEQDVDYARNAINIEQEILEL